MVSSTKPVLLDTNFVLDCYKCGIHLGEIDTVLDEAYELWVPQNVLIELGQLTLKGKDEEARKTMLKVLGTYPVLPLQGAVDASLIQYAREHDCIICTNDRDLRKNLRKIGKKAIFVRSKSHLEIE